MDFALNFEQQALVDALEKFCQQELYPHEALVDTLRTVPQEIQQEIRRKSEAAGFVGMALPTAWGGPGLDRQTLMQAERVLGKTSTALTFCMNRGVTGILFKCQGDQIQEYLEPCIRGERLDAFALTEPGAGSDARGIRTKAVRDGDDWVINGVKQFISHADVADFIILTAVTGVDDTPQGERKRFTSFLVDKSLPGVRVEPLKSIVTHGYNPTMVYLDDVRVPNRKILGEEGKGFDMANEWLYDGRVALSAHCVGRAQRMFEMTKEWAATREAFGKTIGEFQGVGFKIANMAVDIKLGDLMVKEAAWQLDTGRMNRTEASMVNYYCSEMVFRVADHAVQIFGGMGLMEDFPIQRFWRDARIERIWEGTSEVQQDLIAKDLLRPYRHA